MHSTKRNSEPNNSTGRRTALRVAIAAAAFLVVCGCNSGKHSTESGSTGMIPEAPTNGAGQPPAAKGNVAPAPTENVTPAQLEIEDVAIQLNPQEHTPQLAVTVRNTGSSWAETSGGCEWRCPVTIQQITGGLSVEQGDVVRPGQERVLSPGGGVVNICDGNKLPLPLSCNISVQTLDTHMQKVGGVQTLHYSKTVTPP